MKTGTKTKWRGWRERCRCRGCIREDEWGPNGMDGNIRPQRLGFDSGSAPRRAPLFWASAAGRKVEKRSRGKAGGKQGEGRRSGAAFRFTGVKDLIQHDERAIGKFIVCAPLLHFY